jgi:hypothetical protein
MGKKVMKVEKCHDCARKAYCTLRQVVLLARPEDKAWTVTMDYCPMYWRSDGNRTDVLVDETPVLDG